MSRRLKSFGRTLGGGRRKHERKPIEITGKLVTLTERQSGFLLNISVNGAQILMDEPPALGTEIFLILGIGDVHGKVAWRTDTECGIEFYSDVHPFDIQKMSHAFHRDVLLTARARNI